MWFMYYRYVFHDLYKFYKYLELEIFCLKNKSKLRVGPWSTNLSPRCQKLWETKVQEVKIDDMIWWCRRGTRLILNMWILLGVGVFFLYMHMHILFIKMMPKNRSKVELPSGICHLPWWARHLQIIDTEGLAVESLHRCVLRGFYDFDWIWSRRMVHELWDGCVMSIKQCLDISLQKWETSVEKWETSRLEQLVA